MFIPFKVDTLIANMCLKVNKKLEMLLVKPTCRIICIVMFWNLKITEIVPPIFDLSLNPSSLLQTHEFRQQNKLGKQFPIL